MVAGAAPRPSRWAGVATIAGLVVISVGCHTSAMSVEEAIKVTATFSGSSFTPPPRTLHDVTQLLEQEAQPDEVRVAELRTKADMQPPATTQRSDLAEFYYRRSLAANAIARHGQEIQDLTMAADLARGGSGASGLTDLEMKILEGLAYAENEYGNRVRGIEYARQHLRQIPRGRRGDLSRSSCRLARVLARAGDLRASKNAYEECIRIYREFDPARLSLEVRSWWEGLIA